MIKVLFVCTGNICRSPTAHGVFRDKVRKMGLEGSIMCDSAGTHAYHEGELPDRRSAATAKTRGYDLSDLRARKVVYADFEDYDHILCMDQSHVLTLQRVVPKEHLHKIAMFDARDVGDPYYGGAKGFEDVLDQIEAACEKWILDLKPVQ